MVIDITDLTQLLDRKKRQLLLPEKHLYMPMPTHKHASFKARWQMLGQAFVIFFGSEAGLGLVRFILYYFTVTQCDNG